MRLAGLMDPLSSVSVFISPIFAGFVFDSFGSYQGAFLALAAVNASGALLLMGIRLEPSQKIVGPSDRAESGVSN